ncbi:hypothetical protein [Legionella oakridgensis]|uniref:Acetyltransferase n=2 Tax=Legionella oakridgensis TaxID=29423 RepID=W0BDU4_9GAMM|nr:hypothetical protein [Legionella oakridgensis]AHE66856.1 hypothetical protein Loa_01303 [Legionella oakridgensis ATCC 33761 = DSM 21215]ETO93479.1 hypothetical protein LOR_54c11710 [Legionella oakridgensis RV-2-2007]KTD39844.1 acetyltransferase [Legionella oakridgensis]STY19966.1 acetyltransferase [Legionella longbeachae]
MKKWISLLGILLFTFSFSVFAQQASDNSDVKNTCEVSGGTWTESGGNWACCWADWGCYGCVDGVCKIKCYNQRCRDANKIRATDTPGKNYQRIEGLAPAGQLAPIVPKPKTLKAPATTNTVR